MLPEVGLGPLHLTGYYLATTLGICLAAVLGHDRFVRLGGYPRRWAGEAAAVIVAAGIAGAAGGYALVIAATSGRGLGDALGGGSSILGGLTAAALAGAAYARYRGVGLGLAADLAVVPVPLGQAIGRLGCFAGGCCHGRETSSWLGVRLPDENGLWALRFPTQLVSAAVDACFFAILLLVEGRLRRSTRGVPFPGFLFLLFVQLYCIKRVLIEFLRAEPRLPPPLSGVSWAQAVAALALVVASGVMAVRLARANAAGVVERAGGAAGRSPRGPR